MGVYNPYEQMPHSCPSCRFFNCMNYYSNKDFQHEYDCCELTKIKVIDWNAIEANDRFEKWEKWDKIVHEWIDNDRRHESCPLVEIEAPHGRLIDETRINDATVWRGGYDNRICGHIFETDAPTVIEAEE